MIRAKATINLDALRWNIRQVRACIPMPVKIAGVIKGNAYGHGMLPSAHALRDLVDYFAVAHIGEAIVLREAGIQRPIVVLGGFYGDEELAVAIANNLTPMVHCDEQLQWLAARKQIITIWLKCDSGMGRLGFQLSRYADVWQKLHTMPWVTVSCIATHLACADQNDDAAKNKTTSQIKLFSKLLNSINRNNTCISIANSAGVLAWPAAHADIVRPGIMLYGVSPIAGATGATHDLRPVMTFSAPVMAVKTIAAGDSVGYGAIWRATKPTRIALVNAGYADGYPRHAPNGTPVMVNNRCAPLCGRVSMDSLAIDIDGRDDVRVGDMAILWGDGLPAEMVASKAGTIAYELLCKITARVQREYIYR